MIEFFTDRADADRLLAEVEHDEPERYAKQSLPAALVGSALVSVVIAVSIWIFAG